MNDSQRQILNVFAECRQGIGDRRLSLLATLLRRAGQWDVSVFDLAVQAQEVLDARRIPRAT